MFNNLNIVTWNATDIMSSCSYLCDMLKHYKVDICGLSEHWLRETDLHFLSSIDSMYKNHSVCDKDLRIPCTSTVRKGGVAILWNNKYSDKISELQIDDDRIVGIEFEWSKNCYLYIFQVYFPSSNHSLNKFIEYVEKLNDVVNSYRDRGIIIVMGDLNAHLNTHQLIKKLDERSVRLKQCLLALNLISVNSLSTCIGAKSTFVSYNGVTESLIDHIIIPSEHSDIVVSCEILDDDALNVSNHRPLLCKLNLPILSHSINDYHTVPKLKWSKAKTNSLNENHF